MHESSRRLYECLDDMYENDWYGRKDVDSICEVIVLLSPFFSKNVFTHL